MHFQLIQWTARAHHIAICIDMSKYASVVKRKTGNSLRRGYVEIDRVLSYTHTQHVHSSVICKLAVIIFAGAVILRIHSVKEKLETRCASIGRGSEVRDWVGWVEETPRCESTLRQRHTT